MGKSGIVILFILGFVICTHAGNRFFLSASDSNPICKEVKSSVLWKYCFSVGVGKSVRKLILQFHGGGESEKTWFESTGLGEQVRQSWRNSGIQAPSIVSVSFGPMWLLSKRSLLPQSGLYEVFVNEIFPYIEKQLMNGRIDERILIGHSMGGFNAGTLGLQNAPFFSKIALLCPALGNEGSDIDSYIKKTGAWLPYARYLFKIRDQYFLSSTLETEVSPLTLIRRISPGKNGPKFFLSCGDKDQYGFYFGANTFIKLSKMKGFQVLWKPVANGQHCSVDTDALAKFLQ
ncbi:MAG: hypothetical protein J0M15_06625 [Deltaproteobacteria bacterium]|nr:hypothetical protein [Deltaproteobacteria bacterium]